MLLLYISRLSNSPHAELQTRVIAPCFVRQRAPGLPGSRQTKNLRRLQTCEIGPCNEPARGKPVFSGLAFLISPEGARGTQGVSPRPRRHVGDHVASCAFQAHDTVSCWNSTRQTAASDAVHTPAFRTRRFYRLATPSGATTPGALTECWASPHCWVLGPPTPSAGHRPFTTLQKARFNGAPSHERPTDATGPSHPAPAPVMLPARLFVGAGQPINIPGRRTNQELFLLENRNTCKPAGFARQRALQRCTFLERDGLKSTKPVKPQAITL